MMMPCTSFCYVALILILRIVCTYVTQSATTALRKIAHGDARSVAVCIGNVQEDDEHDLKVIFLSFISLVCTIACFAAHI